MIEAAEGLLDSSTDRDISTRAVCDSVGIGAPTLYRLFGDKKGLLKAVVDHGFDRYLDTKRAAARSTDPVDDLREGWDTHIAFAQAHPSVYRMMYSPAFDEVPAAAGAALSLLETVLRRCAADGLLRVEVRSAAQAIMAANIGMALSLITQPQSYDDPELSQRVRDAVHRSVLTPAAAAAAPTRSPAAADANVPESHAARQTIHTARQLTALLAHQQTPLTDAESTLLREWLTRLTSRPTPS